MVRKFSTSAEADGNDAVVMFGSLSLLRCFAGKGIAVTAVDSDPQSLSLRSRYCAGRQIIACPRNDPDAAVRDLVNVAKQIGGRPLLAFDNDPMLLLVSRHREILAPYYRFLLPAADLVEDLVGKLRFVGMAERLGLPTPKSMIPTGATTIEEIVQRIGLPCILKPNSHLGKFRGVVESELHRPHKVFRVDTIEELRHRYSQMRLYCDAFIVQECIAGDDDQLYSFHAYYDHNSRLTGCFVGRKIRTYPKDTGFSTCLELIHNHEIVDLGLSIMARMKFVGPMKLDFKRDAARKQYLLLECNPRFNLWHYLGAACGINLPMMAYADLRGETVTPVTHYRTSRRWLAFGNDFRAFMREYRPSGALTWPRYLWSLRHRAVHDVFAWRDPAPWCVCMGQYLGANWRKLRRRLGRNANVVAPVPAPAD